MGPAANDIIKGGLKTHDSFHKKPPPSSQFSVGKEVPPVICLLDNFYVMHSLLATSKSSLTAYDKPFDNK